MIPILLPPTSLRWLIPAAPLAPDSTVISAATRTCNAVRIAPRTDRQVQATPKTLGCPDLQSLPEDCCQIFVDRGTWGPIAGNERRACIAEGDKRVLVDEETHEAAQTGQASQVRLARTDFVRAGPLDRRHGRDHGSRAARRRRHLIDRRCVRVVLQASTRFWDGRVTSRRRLADCKHNSVQ